jgi:large subunit ribosomal protein L22
MPSHDIRAEARSVSVSAQKARLVVDLVRGKPVVQALDMLKFMTNGAAHPVSKVMASAVANAEENFGVSRDDLYVYRIYADEARTRRWRRFGPRGRFKPLLRRSSHITVVLREKE